MSHMNLCRNYILADFLRKNKPLRSEITYLFITFHERYIFSRKVGTKKSATLFPKCENHGKNPGKTVISILNFLTPHNRRQKRCPKASCGAMILFNPVGATLAVARIPPNRELSRCLFSGRSQRLPCVKGAVSEAD